jgi:hypothetical protein
VGFTCAISFSRSGNGTLLKLSRGLSLNVLGHSVDLQPKDVPYDLEKSDEISTVEGRVRALRMQLRSAYLNEFQTIPRVILP